MTTMFIESESPAVITYLESVGCRVVPPEGDVLRIMTAEGSSPGILFDFPEGAGKATERKIRAEIGRMLRAERMGWYADPAVRCVKTTPVTAKAFPKKYDRPGVVRVRYYKHDETGEGRVTTESEE